MTEAKEIIFSITHSTTSADFPKYKENLHCQNSQCSFLNWSHQNTFQMMQNIQDMNAKSLESGKLRLQGFYREIPVTHNFAQGRNAPKTTSGGS